jgi:hypothetical protein
MSQGKIIGITGLYGSGKDTVADIIASVYPQLNWQKLHLADGVKAVYEALTGQKVPAGEAYNQHWKAQYNSTLECTNREILEGIGHGLRNSIHQDVWVKRLEIKLRDGGNYIIPDVRYPNELRVIEQHGGRMIRVSRPDNPTIQTDSPANSELSQFDMITITNDGHLGDLLNKTIDVIEELFHITQI